MPNHGGKRPKPSYLKLVEGRPNTLKTKNEPKPRFQRPTPVPGLTPGALEEWHRISEELYAIGVLSQVDRAVMGAYCTAYDRWRQAEQILQEFAERAAWKGFVVKTINGNMIVNPMLGVSNKAMKDMVYYAIELGLTPSARSRIEAFKAGDGEDTDKFFS